MDRGETGPELVRRVCGVRCCELSPPPRTPGITLSVASCGADDADCISGGAPAAAGVSSYPMSEPSWGDLAPHARTVVPGEETTPDVRSEPATAAAAAATEHDNVAQ